MKAALLLLIAGCSDSYTPPDRSGIMVNNSGLDGSIAEDAAPSSLAAALESSAVVLSFGNVLTNTRSAGQSTTISNTGGASVISSLDLSGAGAAVFVIDSETCVGESLAGAATCAARVRFAPTAAGATEATLTVNGSANGLVTLLLKGTGMPAGALEFMPANGAFGNVAALAFYDVTFQLQNVSTTPSGAISVEISGADANLFHATANNCAGGLAASGTCNLTVRFSPTALGARSATLSASDALGGTMTAALNGTGT